jgi:hypothetical protein
VLWLQWAALIGLVVAAGAYALRRKAVARRPGSCEVYAALRSLALETKPDEIIGAAGPHSSQAYGVVVDFRIDACPATLACFASGDAGLYMSTGGSIMGGAGKAKVSSAARAAVEAAQAHLHDLAPTTDHPGPPAGRVSFYLLTTLGLMGADVDEDVLAHDDHPLSALFADIQRIVAEIRTAAP